MRLGFSPSTARILDLEAAYRLAVELDLEFLELAWELQEIDPRLQHPERVRELSRATGVGVTLHLPFMELNLASVFPGVAQNSLERVRRALEYGARVDASVGVLHTGRVPEHHPQVLEAAWHTLHASLEALRDPPFPIALENTALEPRDLLRGPAELEALCARFGMGATLDFGHAFVEGGAELLARYQQELTQVLHLHLHDNSGQGDEHLPVGRGAIPWEAQAAYLRTFSGTADLEIAGSEAEVRAAVAHLRAVLAG
ncbi:sugar phosphate isomerase/epimerase [Deinobacterium chartae]|uniref:Sugar phosphate isomerase/epimerase n=1 Tax=Deinobacterium chartae TaxID=521158 RepID=A0A841I480_9DEIO|nr:sugar phosphate isomerase/epimerase family protein [Deinobacterium chartae]MBB6099109.1 sugar phosphate isomerase/epimerase [Deinobacterium chartae]